MELSEKKLDIFRIVFLVLLLVSVGLNVYLLTKENEYKTVEKVRVRVERDTIRDTVSKVISEKVLCLRTDTFRVVDSVKGDTVTVQVPIPITQKVYADDSTYRAWISGYRQNLDSIEVYRKNVYTDREIIKYRRQRFAVGPYVGVGFDGKEVRPNVGIGISYNLFGF